jgi:anti-sigma factor RsiW
MAHDREVAGIRCTQVLSLLSDYVDGDIADTDRRRVEAHLRGCDWCARFGGQFSDTVVGLREQLRDPAPLDRGAAQRLAQRLGIHREGQ